MQQTILKNFFTGGKTAPQGESIPGRELQQRKSRTFSEITPVKVEKEVALGGHRGTVSSMSDLKTVVSQNKRSLISKLSLG